MTLDLLQQGARAALLRICPAKPVRQHPTKALLSEWGRMGGKIGGCSRSEKKAAAARENGRKSRGCFSRSSCKIAAAYRNLAKANRILKARRRLLSPGRKEK